MKRWSLRILLFLLVGAATTVGVAWAIAWHYEPEARIAAQKSRIYVRGDTSAESPCWMVSYWSAPGLVIVHRFPVDESFRAERNNPGIPVLQPNDIPRWSAARFPPQEVVADPIHTFIEVGFGWPLIVMDYECELIHSHRTWKAFQLEHTDSMIAMTPRTPTSSVWDGTFGLPLRIEWTPFATSSAFYAFAWGALVSSLTQVGRTLRKAIRSRKGSCFNCGYDLQGVFNNGCPECGWNREP